MLVLRISEINTAGKRDWVVDNLYKRMRFLNDIVQQTKSYKTEEDKNRFWKSYRLLNETWSRIHWMKRWGLIKDYVGGFTVESVTDSEGNTTYTKAPYFYIKMMEKRNEGK